MMQRALASLVVVLALFAAPGSALAQSAGDDQYVDPFHGGADGQEQPAQNPAPESPAEPAPAPDDGVASTETGVEADASQSDGSELPRTGLPLVLIFSAGYALLLGGIAIRRKTR